MVIDPLAIAVPVLLNYWWLFAILALFAIFRTSWFKGLFGEFLVRLLARLNLDQMQYRAFHNVMLATPDGTTQIDHIFVSPFGIFVVETKNMKGWIFGSASQATWTQQIYRNKFKFQNPLRQNYKHTKALESLLDVPPEVIHSVIVFVGDSTFKTAMPDNVTYAMGFVRYIKSKAERVLSDAQVDSIASAIKSGKLKNSFQLQREHVRSLKSRSDPTSDQLCPRCGSPMVVRTSTKGANPGSQFWGCSQYPKCRAVRSLT